MTRAKVTMYNLHLFGLLSCLPAFTHAWLPSDRRLALFNTSTTATSHLSPQNQHPINVGTRSPQLTPKWLPASGKIRGVNLGALFITEPWMASTAWANMGCSGTSSEFDCVLKLGQSAADAAFQSHWNSWITQDDLKNMAACGLNTIRIPVGYWIYEDLVYSDSEHFPRGGLGYLDRIVGWASDLGFYIIIDLHGAPGAQVANQPFTGQNAPSAGFYQWWQYDRAYSFLTRMAQRIHTTTAYRNVGMLELVNEPISGQSSLISQYYPTAFSKIRAAEQSLGVTANNYLHIQMMDQSWGAGDPKAYLTDQYFAAYDNHRYLKWDTSVPVTYDGYISTSCNDNVASDGDTPVIVGEWSISVSDAVESSSAWEPWSGNNNAFYKKWWAAQVIAYEKQAGWIFWSWKAELGDYRWSYKDAVAAGVIPTDPNQAYKMGVC